MARKKAEAPAEKPEEKIPAAEAPNAPPSGPEVPTGVPEDSGESRTAPEASREGIRAVVRSAKGLNLRAGPGPGFDVGEVLPDGAEVSVLTLLAEGGPQGAFEFHIPGWKYIFTGRRVGWADARFLEESGHGQS